MRALLGYSRVSPHAQTKSSYQNDCAAARRARPVLGIGMYHAYAKVLSAPFVPT